MPEYERRKEWGFNILEKYGRDHFFQKVKRLLLDADTVIANLETPLINDEFITRPSFSFSATSRYVQKQGRFQHWSNGPNTVEHLKNNNIRIVSLANNHMLDYGKDGLVQTISVLKNGGIKFFRGKYEMRHAQEIHSRKLFLQETKMSNLLLFLHLKIAKLTI